MMMNFKSLNKYRSAQYKLSVGIVILFFTTQLNAEVAVKNIEKNDKVISNTLPSEKLLPPTNAGVLYAEQWELTRSGEYILSLPAVNSIINSWLQDKQKKIEIQYPGGEEGEFWVQELTDWLVSLGIPSNHLLTVPGSGADDKIKFALIK